MRPTQTLLGGGADIPLGKHNQSVTPAWTPWWRTVECAFCPESLRALASTDLRYQL